MKKLHFTIALLFMFSLAGFSQNGPVGHLTIFSEDGDKFKLILNGELQNDIPQTNLRIEDLSQPYYNAKIQFEDKTLQDISKTIWQLLMLMVLIKMLHTKLSAIITTSQK